MYQVKSTYFYGDVGLLINYLSKTKLFDLFREFVSLFGVWSKYRCSLLSLLVKCYSRAALYLFIFWGHCTSFSALNVRVFPPATDLASSLMKIGRVSNRQRDDRPFGSGRSSHLNLPPARLFLRGDLISDKWTKKILLWSIQLSVVVEESYMILYNNRVFESLFEAFLRWSFVISWRRLLI